MKYKRILLKLSGEALMGDQNFGIDNNNLKSISIFKGPAIFNEQENFRLNYFERNYKWSLFDFNNDGIREFVVKFHTISRIYFYQDSGKWIAL